MFERINQRLYTTPAATAFYQKARHIIDTFDEMETTLKDWDELGQLRVGASITLGNTLMPALSAQMKELFPRIRTYVRISPGERLVGMLLSNELDVAFIEHSVQNEYLLCESFSRDRMVVVAAPDHPLSHQSNISLRDIAAEPLLMRQHGSVGRSFVSGIFEANDLHPDVLWESASTQALVHATQTGLGLAILPEELVRQDLQCGLLTELKVRDVNFERTHYIVRHKNKYVSKAMKELIRLAHEAGSREDDHNS